MNSRTNNDPKDFRDMLGSYLCLGCSSVFSSKKKHVCTVVKPDYLVLPKHAIDTLEKL